MAKSILVLLLITYLALERVKSNPIEEVSYVDLLDFKYIGGRWYCGGFDCAPQASGCQISIKTLKTDKKKLVRRIECTKASAYIETIQVHVERIIDIEITTYDGAKSKYWVKYGLGGREMAKGIVAPADLPQLKKKFNKIKNHEISKSKN